MPIRKPFNPIDIPNIALNLAMEVLEQPILPLPPSERPSGAGVYLLYYKGAFEPYLPYRGPNPTDPPKLPIYVGKAVRAGTRKGFRFDPPQGHEIDGRLKNHINSINLADNLELSDFQCRYLSVEDSFIGLAESILVSIFDPLWNRVLDGFGNNPTGSPREGQGISKWDQFHPGRRRGTGAARITAETLAGQVANYFHDSEAVSDIRLIEIRGRIAKYGLG